MAIIPPEFIESCSSPDVLHGYMRDLQNTMQHVRTRLTQLGQSGVEIWVRAHPEGAGDKISAIKALRELSGLGLREAKAMADAADWVMVTDMAATSPGRALAYSMLVTSQAVEIEVRETNPK